MARIAVIRTILKRRFEDFGGSGVYIFEFELKECVLDWMFEKSNASSLVIDCLYRYFFNFQSNERRKSFGLPAKPTGRSEGAAQNYSTE